MSYFSLIFTVFTLSCVTKNVSNPQQEKNQKLRANETKCLKSLLGQTTGSTATVAPNTIIYLAQEGTDDTLYTPYTTYKIETSSELTKYCFRLPTDHSVWAVDKASTGERLINDDTCTSFLKLKEVKGRAFREDKILKADIDARLVQIKDLRKKEKEENEAVVKSDDKSEEVKDKYTNVDIACADYLTGNNLK